MSQPGTTGRNVVDAGSNSFPFVPLDLGLLHTVPVWWFDWFFISVAVLVMCVVCFVDLLASGVGRRHHNCIHAELTTPPSFFQFRFPCYPPG